MRLIISESMLQEGYREVHELNYITNEIIYSVAKENSGFLFRLKRNKGFDKNWLYFNYDHFIIKDMIKNIDAYPLMGDCINNGLKIFFTTHIDTLGNYVSTNNTINIKTNIDDFYDNLLYHLDLHGESLDTDSATRSLRTSIGVAFRSIIIHELQHAYDSYRSKNKYTTDRVSKKYYDKKRTLNVPFREMSQDMKNIYLILPHEYWARFSETVNDIYITKDMRYVENQFIKNLRGWELLDEPTKKKLLKALYKYREFTIAQNADFEAELAKTD